MLGAAFGVDPRDRAFVRDQRDRDHGGQLLEGQTVIQHLHLAAAGGGGQPRRRQPHLRQYAVDLQHGLLRQRLRRVMALKPWLDLRPDHARHTVLQQLLLLGKPEIHDRFLATFVVIRCHAVTA